MDSPENFPESKDYKGDPVHGVNISAIGDKVATRRHRNGDEDRPDSRRLGGGILAEVEVGVEAKCHNDDESIEDGDPGGTIGDWSEGVDRAEDFDGEDAQKGKIDSAR